MNISNETLDILRNFSSINSGLTVQQGNELKTVSAMKNIFAKAIVSENFDKEHSIYDLSVPTRFHGDFQPENILHDGDDFKLIDWRDSFGKSLEIGDFYYDLGKLYHAIIINGQIVLSKGYSYEIKNNTAFLEYNLKSNLNLLMIYFENFCKERDISWSNVELLGILQYIGICSLYKEFHDGEYGKFLFLLGKYMLAKKLSED